MTSTVLKQATLRRSGRGVLDLVGDVGGLIYMLMFHSDVGLLDQREFQNPKMEVLYGTLIPYKAIYCWEIP